MSNFETTKTRRASAMLLASVAALALAGCQGLGENNPFKKRPDGAEASVAASPSSVRLVERDVEAPEVFQVTDEGLWDGRPSLGGVWVAHPDVKEPERVIIRHAGNGKFVIGALFRRERANPGPRLQVSSDAAAALGMLAGAPQKLNVTALRREEAPEAGGEGDPTAAELAPEAVETTTLDPIAGAAAAIDKAEAAGGDTAITPAAAPVPAPAPAAAPKPAPKPAAASNLSKPYLQIGIFSVEENANNTATAMRQAGMVPTVLEQSSKGKTFWRVIVGPASTASERAALLKKIQDIGFDDAYAVTN